MAATASAPTNGDTHTCGHEDGHFQGYGHSEPGSNLAPGQLKRQKSTPEEVDWKIVDPNNFERLKQALVDDGPEKLIVVADFDRTISTLRADDGDYNLSSHGMLEQSPALPEDYRRKAHGLFERYYPIEFNPDIPDDEKQKHLIDWWSQAHELLIENHLTRSDIVSSVTSAIKSNKIKLRDGVREFLQLCADNNVQVVVFSAGLYDCINELFKQLNLLTPNLRIASNQMMFNNDGLLVGFKGHLIHSLNKNWTSIECQLEHPEHSNTPRAKTAKEIQQFRDFTTDEHTKSMQSDDKEQVNVILLGDNVADIKMTHGLQHMKTEVKIGFVNDKVTERIDQYSRLFDVLILNDGTFKFPIQLVQEVIQQHRTKHQH